METMEMRADKARAILARAFYGLEPWWMKLLLLIGLITLPLGVGLVFLLIWLIAKIVFKFSRVFNLADIYEQCRLDDMEFLKERAITEMHLIEEEFSLVDPIISSGYPDNEQVIFYGEKLEATSYLKAYWRAFVKFICFWRPTQKISERVYLECGEDNIICSIVAFSYIAFTEQQVVSYTCCYDIAYGIILKEWTTELAYRDIDALRYGDHTLHVWSINKQEWSKVKISLLQLCVASGMGIAAWHRGATELLENQLPAVQALIRSKKEELA